MGTGKQRGDRLDVVPATTSRTAGARRQPRASWVGLRTVAHVVSASSRQGRVRGRIAVRRADGAWAWHTGETVLPVLSEHSGYA